MYVASLFVFLLLAFPSSARGGDVSYRDLFLLGEAREGRIALFLIILVST